MPAIFAIFAIPRSNNRIGKLEIAEIATSRDISI